MKPLSTFGFLLIVIGAGCLLYVGVTSLSSQNVIDVGPVRIDVKENRPFPVTPVAGAIATIAGVLFVLADKRNRLMGAG